MQLDNNTGYRRIQLKLTRAMPEKTKGIEWNYRRKYWLQKESGEIMRADATDYRKSQIKLCARIALTSEKFKWNYARDSIEKSNQVKIRARIPLTTKGIKWNYAREYNWLQKESSEIMSAYATDYRKSQVK